MVYVLYIQTFNGPNLTFSDIVQLLPKHNIQCNLYCVIPFAKNMIYLYVQVTQVER